MSLFRPMQQLIWPQQSLDLSIMETMIHGFAIYAGSNFWSLCKLCYSHNLNHSPAASDNILHSADLWLKTQPKKYFFLLVCGGMFAHFLLCLIRDSRSAAFLLPRATIHEHFLSASRPLCIFRTHLQGPFDGESNTEVKDSYCVLIVCWHWITACR